jgi:ABC-2 type transport system permease protein
VEAWAITVCVLILGLLIGAMVGLTEWSAADAGEAIGAIGLAAILTIALQAGTAFFAGVGRGYIAPLAWAIATISASQILAVLGWGAWFPWSVPAILAGAGGAAVEPVGPGGIALVLLTAAVWLAATFVWWERADQTG